MTTLLFKVAALFNRNLHINRATPGVRSNDCTSLIVSTPPDTTERCENELNTSADTVASTTTPVLGSSECEASSIIPEIKHILQDLFVRIAYRPPHTTFKTNLRSQVADEILSWGAGLDMTFVEHLTLIACGVAETAYGHTSYEHQRLVAMYTVCVVWVDDQCRDNAEAVGQFVQRYARGERQLNIALEKLAEVLATVHDLYPRISADAIVSSTLDSMSSMYLEVLTEVQALSPHAGRFPEYLRLKTGIGCAYSHFNFMKSWGDSAGPYYLQVVPDLEIVIVKVNDILSFYKEVLAGEKDNYVHLRARIESVSPIAVLRQMVEESLESIKSIERIAAAQPEVGERVSYFIMGYVEFHCRVHRYRLKELGIDFEA